MNKPISKHALRRAIEKVGAEGLIQYAEPIGTVVDRIWHEVEKATYNSEKKAPISRNGIKVAVAPDSLDIDLP
jgi:DNA-binding FadR family transcriptional regulator